MNLLDNEDHVIARCLLLVLYCNVMARGQSPIAFRTLMTEINHFCGLVVRVPGYRSRGLGFDSRRYQIF
jgi:hypothetical protein